MNRAAPLLFPLCVPSTGIDLPYIYFLSSAFSLVKVTRNINSWLLSVMIYFCVKLTGVQILTMLNVPAVVISVALVHVQRMGNALYNVC
jgi:hypothetical protein